MGSRSQAGQELDKLKRRLIRSVARLIKEKKTEDEVWDEMRKECGGKCKKLWMRMRSLTLKKLKRLIDADDRTEFVPAVARMNLTDWLLYDLVLVHEKIDVINRSETGDSKVLNNLFALVQRYQIEGRSGDDLAEAWIAATVSYNSRGHQCSPMLMQRRWYQLKELTRHKLYQFWFNYRGNKRLLIAAKQNPPTTLQRAVALRFPEIITKEFPSWEDRIETNLVIMPEEFEIKMNKKDLMKPFDEAVPDVVIVEKKIDTITVESDSDFDDDGNDKEPNPEVRGKDEPSQTPVIVQVKTEPEYPYNDIDITEHPVYAEEPKDRFQDAIERLTIEEDRVAMSHVNTDETPQEEYVMPLITNVVGAVTDTEFFNISTTNINMEKEKENSPNVFISEVKKRVEENKKSTIVSFAINEELENVVKTFDDNSQESIVIDDDEDDVMSNNPDAGQIASNVIDITSPKAKVNEIDSNRMTCIARNAYSDKTNIVESSNANEVSPVITTILSGSAVKAKMEIDTDFENEDNVGGEILKVVRDAEELEEDIIQIEHEKEHSVSSSATIIETNVADDGFEFADDGIEFDEDHNDQSEMNEIPEKESSPEENADTPKFDLKLLMHPVVYTTKLDDIDACKGISFFNTIDDKCLVDKIFLESKPVSIKSVNVEQIKAENDEEGNDILVKGEEFDDDLFQNESSNDSENSNSGIDDCNRVKPTSFLLQKPRSRSYNPIQLCKNPDFNTRLKRLPLGFFSSERNRVFLKACKPMTIDLSKAFESKLINGTMYLKPSDSTITSVVKDVDDSGSSASITPSAVAVQSLMDTTDVDKILQDELIKRMLERNKTINLPNISVVRQINQKLLMAEVAPIITQVDKSTHEAQVQALDNSTVDKTNNINMQNKEVTNGKPTNVDKQTLQVNEITNHSSTNSLKPTILLMHSSSTNIEKQTTLMNSDKSDQDIVSDSLLPMKNNDKSREDKTLEKQKKKYSKLNVHKPLWLSKYTHFDTKPNESLLTIDTLYRVLNALDPSSVEYKKPKSKGQKSTASKFGKPQGSTSSNKPSNQNQPINNQDSSVQITTNSEDLIEQALANLPSDPSKSLTTTPQVTTPSTTVLTSTKTAKTKASNLTKKQRNCCWSRAKINKLNGLTNVRENKHKCPPAHCRCCCREILRQTEINLEIQLLENMQNRDQFDETIEQVVQQSRNSPHVTQCVTQINTTLLEATQNQQVLPMLSSVQPFNHHDLYKDNAFLLPQPASKINVAKQADVDDYESVTIVNNAPEDTEPQLIIDTDISDNVPEETIDLVDDDDVSEIPTPTPKIRVYSAGPSLTSRPIRDLSSRKKNRNDEQHYPTPLPLELAVAAPQAPPVLPRNPTPPILPPVGTPLPKVLHKGSKVAAKITKTPGTASTSTLEDVINTLPCSCRPNVVVDKLSAMLVVDGSNECPQHTKSRVSKETRIYLNRRHMSAATRPFYVGKNKILLTNITPRKAEPRPPPPPPQTTPLELPAGVQIVLLPDGTVSYLLDPGAELTHEQKQAMPAILASILEHIKASGITLPVDVPEEENTNINSDIDNKNNENSHVNVSENNNANESSMLMSKPNDNDIVQTELRKETNQETSNEVNSLSENQKDLEKEINQETSVLNSNTDDSATDVELCIQEAQEKNDLVQDTASKDTNNLVENDKTDNIADNATTNNTAENEKRSSILVSSSRNLLSDLMEMSGILEEDINPIQQPVNTGSIHSLTIDTSRNSSVQSERPVSPVPEKHVISARINETIYNLNPITSFAELKYACDNNGLFFKLDLNNGLIVPINVCIQKTPESAAKTVNPSEVIDLTDEQNFTIEEPATSSNIQPKPAIGFDLTSRPKPSIKVNKHGKSKIKLHIIKPKDMSMMLENPRGRGRLPKYNSQLPENQMEIDNETPPAQEITSPVQSSIEERKALMKKLSNNLKPLKFHHDKRSPIILRKNSLLNTHTPIGKRISNLNNKPETEIYTETEYLESTDDSDDDDEPLAKIARKMRPNETGEQANSQDQRASQGNDNGDEVDFEEAIDAISEVEPPTILNTLLNDVPMVEPVPTQLVVSGTALKQPLPTELNDSLSFVVDESDQDSDGDCILGV